MEEEYSKFIQQILELEIDTKKKQQLIDNLNNPEFQNKFYIKTKENIETIIKDEKVKRIFHILFPYFLKQSFRRIILLLWKGIDWRNVPLDQLQKLIRLFVDNFNINQDKYRQAILDLLNIRNDIEEYTIRHICSNTINIDYLNQFLNKTKSESSHHLIKKAIRSIQVLHNNNPGLEYFLLIFHGDFTKTTEYIESELGIDVFSQILEANEQDGELLETKIYHSKTGQHGKVIFGRKEGNVVETLMSFRDAQVSVHSNGSQRGFIFNCSSTSSAIITTTNINYISDARIGRSCQNIFISLYHSPIFTRSNRCGCEIRAVSHVLTKCNCVIITFYDKSNNKLFHFDKKDSSLSLNYKNYLPFYEAKSSTVQHLYDYDKLELVSEDAVTRLESFINSNNSFTLTLFTRTIMFCHIPLCSQLYELMTTFAKSKININQILPSTPLNIQEEVKGILPWIINFNYHSSLKQYHEINIKTPTKLLHLGFHKLPFIPKESAELFYFRDEGMGIIDFAPLQHFNDNHPFPQKVIYSFDDLLQGRFWVPTQLNGDITLSTTLYPNHYPLYLNSYSIQNLISLGLSQDSINAILMDLVSQIETPSTSRYVSLQFLPINQEHQKRVYEIFNRFFGDNVNFTQCDLPIICHVMKILETRLKRGLLPIINGGTFICKIDEKNILRSGEISLRLKSFNKTDFSSVLIMSPFLEKGMARRFNNVLQLEWEPNIVHFSKQDIDYFNILNKFQNKCNCIWDTIILNEIGECKYNLPPKEDYSPFVGDNYHTFIKQYIKITSERVPIQKAHSLMSEILSPTENTSITYSFIPPRSYNILFQPPLRIVKKQKIISTWSRTFFFLLDGISQYRRHFRCDEVPASWVLQILGNIDDPFIGFQLSEFFEVVDNFHITEHIKNGNNALFYGLVYLLTQEEIVSEFVSNYVELTHLEEI
ncbi:hypothetical protein EDI_249060 [Entamoeba dispar SAW760]|uniref:RNA-directed RNA polymerase n=1 Tax=Entamoeba dispar (strain ATCC PRA-260 / SAW760) TaxID=370354 RepID=B0E967_ENTDS|nr:uncharacterized protein EDI_249060 [Entamoeba dispar SAW760]EDR28896.1 hypothetical protein EDI_249060 [Entamoeba dispar SAW760]|eukprot:EDR28896.1 hypothetical protein EDI_249060 [Entamoeba dispar SAW760]